MKKEILTLLLPTGTLEESTTELFKLADAPIKRLNERQFTAQIDDPPCRVFFFRPQDIPNLLMTDQIDAGICGKDCAVEGNCLDQIVLVEELPYGKILDVDGKTKLVVIGRQNDPIKEPVQIRPGARIATEFPNIAQHYFESLGITILTSFTHGSTESWVANNLADYGLELIESGETLRANNLEEIGQEPVLESCTCLFANPKSWENPQKREIIEEIARNLKGVLDARGQVFLHFHISGAGLEPAIKIVPAMRVPTISQLYSYNGPWFAVGVVVPEKQIVTLTWQLRKLDAKDFVVQPIQKVIP